MLLLRFSHQVVSNSLQPRGLQHARLPCPSLSLRVCSNSCWLIQWCYLTILSSVAAFSCLQSSKSIRVFSSELALGIRWPSIGASASASASVLPLSTQDLISFRIDWFEIFAAQGTLKSLLQYHNSKASIIWHSVFFMVQLSHLSITIGKIIALAIWTFISKVMSLVFNNAV